VTRYFLTRVSVEGFRGINNEGAPLVLEFKTDRVNSVFAPNGSGKSSLYEALEYAFRGRVSRLKGMQAAENPDSYISNLFHSHRRATILLTLMPDDGSQPVTVKIEREETGARRVSSDDVPDPEALLAAMDEDFALLDYTAFNRFIEDTALDRGRTFSSLLGLSEYGDFLRSLKAAANTQTFKADFEITHLDTQLSSLRSQAERALRDFASHYRTLTAREIEDVSLADIWGNHILDSLRGIALLEPALAKCAGLDEVDFDALRTAVFDAENGALRERHAALSASHARASTLAGSRSSDDDFGEICDRMQRYSRAREAATEAELQNLLDAASQYLHLHESASAVCPLCERDGTDGLLERVDNRLAALKELRTAEQALLEAVARGAFVSRLAELEQHTPALDNSLSVSEQIRESVRGGVHLTSELLDSANARMEALENLLAERVRTIGDELSEVETSLPPSLVQLAQQVAAAESSRADLKRHLEARSAAASVDEQLRVSNEWKAFIDAAHRAFADAEAEMSQRILEDLRSDYRQLFEGVMNVGDIVPNLARSQGSEQLSVELTNFHGAASVSARAVLSESYRNALAISVFLAAASRHGKSPRFVVLDDVTSSFDAGHQYRLMEQIRTRLQHDGTNGGLQVILLSHDVTLEKYFDRLDDGRGWHHQKLQGWPPVTPVTSHNQNVDRLRVDAERYLRAGQVPEGSGLIRQYLEYVLQQVIRKLQIPVPIDLAVNDHSKMVGACLDAIVDAVDVRRSLGTIVLEPQQISDLTSRHVPAIVANWVSHYGTAGSSSFSPASLLGVLQDIDAIRRCFQFDASGSGDWRFYKSLTRRA